MKTKFELTDEQFELFMKTQRLHAQHNESSMLSSKSLDKVKVVRFNKGLDVFEVMYKNKEWFFYSPDGSWI